MLQHSFLPSQLEIFWNVFYFFRCTFGNWACTTGCVFLGQTSGFIQWTNFPTVVARKQWTIFRLSSLLYNNSLKLTYKDSYFRGVHIFSTAVYCLLLLSSSDTSRTLMHLFLFTNKAQREPWCQYVRREYATAINSPCLITLKPIISLFSSYNSLSTHNYEVQLHIRIYTTIKLNLPGCNKVRQFGKLRNLRDHNLKNLPSFGK